MSTITCNSCGMQYDGSGLQPGVQFQCTQCGAMVAVAAAAPPPAAARGPARPRGGPPGRAPARGPAGRGPARGPARGPKPMAGGMQGQDQQPQMPYGPKKSSNAGLFVGIGVGAVVLVLIIVAVIASGGPSPEDLQRQKTEEAAQQRKEAAAKRDEETRKANEAITKPTEASMAQAPAVIAALQNEDAGTLEALFDWQVYSAYNQTLVELPDKGKDYLNSPLISVGTWEKESSGKYTGIFLGEVPHGAESLKTRVMDYLKQFVFGAPELEWDRAKTESDNAGSFSLTVNNTKYIGKRVFFSYKGAGKTKELWLGAPEGTDQVRLLNYVDTSAAKNLQTLEAKNERVADDNRDPYNPDRDPTNPDRDPPADPDNPPADPDASLPEIAKTGSMPTEPALRNAIEELKRGGDLNVARVNTIKGETSKQQKKDTMGAMIDLLIEAQSSNDRTMKLRISSSLWDIWSPFVPQDWGKDEMVYTLDNFGAQSSLDLPVRRWLDVYNAYPLD